MELTSGLARAGALFASDVCSQYSVLNAKLTEVAVSTPDSCIRSAISQQGLSVSCSGVSICS